MRRRGPLAVGVIALVVAALAALNGVVDPKDEFYSGDALSAAYTWAIQRKSDASDALRWGVAAGTATARLPGMSFATLEQTREMYRQVEVRRVE